ncbi:MAG: hypothetical protein GY835_20230 [bacterium]|nr:hypothetical protein [bacterium]
MTIEEYRAADIATQLKDGDVNALRIIYLSLATGVLLFLGVAVFLSWQGRNESVPPPDSPLIPLSLITVAMLLVCWVSAFWVFDAGFRPGKLGNRLRLSAEINSRGTAEPSVTFLRGALLVRLAMLEAPALLGLVNIIRWITDGALRAQPLYWLNALPALLFIAFVIMTFPTRESLVELYRGRFRQVG